VVWGAVADRAGKKRPGAKLHVTALICVASAGVLALGFGAAHIGLALSQQTQFALFMLGGFLMTCSVGVVAAVVIDVIHPGIRATGASVLSLFQNLLGLAAGPFIAGLLSDAWTLERALIAMPLFALLAAWFFMVASRSYGEDLKLACEPAGDVVESAPVSAPQGAPA
jgi:MFS family permease